jgi:hypothetical protein
MPIEENPAPDVSSLAVPAWAGFIAQDADGTWWAYEAEPNMQDSGWYENEVGRIQRVGKTKSPADFRVALIRLARAAGPPTG